ncbi:MAG TPA: hypothetical protein VLD17_01535 [Gemmatimonadaceae bacterium]|nr:hypothetical protein [Gemmatimonadaceae bacterium]
MCVTAAALLLAWALAQPARAQAPAPSADDPDLTMAVSPTETPPNGPITISGLAYPQAGLNVLITITAPGGVKSSLTAVPDKDAHYSVVFSGTRATGAYTVSVQDGPKGAQAHGAFTVKTYPIDIDDEVADNKALLDESAGLVAAVKKQVDNVPDSPAKTDMETKLAALGEQIKELPAQGPKLTRTLQPFRDLVTAHPETESALQAMFEHLAQLDAEAKTAKEKYAQEVAESQRGVATCDAIDHATQALKAVPEMMEIAKKPFDFAVGFATSMVGSELPPAAGAGVATAGKLTTALPKAVSKPTESLAENEIDMASESEIAEKLVEHIPEPVRESPGYKFAVAETKKFLPSIVDGAKGPLGVFDKVTQLAGDVLAYANEQLFAQYCEKFEGEFTATMFAHFYSKPAPGHDPVEWWNFSTAIKGKLTLRYPKVTSGTAVALSGQFEGGATHFTYYENVFATDLYGKMIKGGYLGKKDVPPAATDNGEGGMVNALTSPTSFYVPVTGQYAGGKITITLGAARTDFNATYTRAHTFYVVIAPTTLMLPVLGHFTLPYMNAHFILDHLISGDYAVGRAGKTMVLDIKEDKHLPGPGNLGVYTMELKACNPGCE